MMRLRQYEFGKKHDEQAGATGTVIAVKCR